MSRETKAVAALNLETVIEQLRQGAEIQVLGNDAGESAYHLVLNLGQVPGIMLGDLQARGIVGSAEGKFCYKLREGKS